MERKIREVWTHCDATKCSGGILCRTHPKPSSNLQAPPTGANGGQSHLYSISLFCAIYSGVFQSLIFCFFLTIKIKTRIIVDFAKRIFISVASGWKAICFHSFLIKKFCKSNLNFLMHWRHLEVELENILLWTWLCFHSVFRALCY